MAGVGSLYAVYGPVTRTCAVAGAAHLGPAVLRPDSSLGFLELPAGPPLGSGGLPVRVGGGPAQGSQLAVNTPTASCGER